MKDNTYFLNTLLTVLLGAVLLAAVIVRAFLPMAIFPKLNIPNIVLLSLLALLGDHYLAPGAARHYGCIALLSSLSFGLFPWLSAFTPAGEALRLAIIGGAVFTAVTWLFTSMQQRLASGSATKAALAVCALGLYLAAQGMTNILL